MPYKDKEKERQQRKRWRASHKDKTKEYSNRFYQNHVGALAKYGRKHLLKLKTEVMIHYSGTSSPHCADPFNIHEIPFTILAALTIDHPKGDGAEERRKLFGTRLRAGAPFYRWLKKHNFPDGYRVLCFNCQWISKAKLEEVMTEEEAKRLQKALLEMPTPI